MGNSLQDQFLKLGLIDKKKVNKTKKEQHQKKKAKGKKRVIDESKILAQKAQEQQKERNRELNRLRNEERRAKESAAQIRQLIETNRLNYDKGDTPYNFTDNNKIKRIFLSKEIADNLGKGRLAIVRQAGEYQIVPADLATKIQKVNKNLVVLLHSQKKQEADTDDPYAEFKVPDDLVW